MPLAPVAAPGILARARGWLAGGLVPWPVAAVAVAVALGGLAVSVQRASALERTLAQQQATAQLAVAALQREAQLADRRSAALERDLDAVEAEAERLYAVVRAMQTLGEQLRQRVGLSGPGIEPLPDLPPGAVRTASRADAADDQRARTVDAGDASAAAWPGVEPRAALGPDPSLPPDTGPWPAAFAAGRPAARPAHLAAADAVARQWDAWQQLAQAIELVLGQRSRAARPGIKPAVGPITSGFGPRAGFWGVLSYHTGVDVSLPTGTAVVAAADGTVTYAGMRPGYGLTVEVQHAGGLLTLYGHLSRPLVGAGQTVAQRQMIALSGNSGISTGPHLHYEIRLNGTPVDPTRYW